MTIYRDRICLFRLFLGTGLMLTVLLGFGGCSSRPQLESWHTEKLDNEFTAELVGEEVRNFRRSWFSSLQSIQRSRRKR